MCLLTNSDETCLRIEAESCFIASKQTLFICFCLPIYQTIYKRRWNDCRTHKVIKSRKGHRNELVFKLPFKDVPFGEVFGTYWTYGWTADNLQRSRELHGKFVSLSWPQPSFPVEKEPTTFLQPHFKPTEPEYLILNREILGWSITLS